MRDRSTTTVPLSAIDKLKGELERVDRLVQSIEDAMIGDYQVRSQREVLATHAAVIQVRQMFAAGEDLNAILDDMSRENVNREAARILIKKVIPLLQKVADDLYHTWDQLQIEFNSGRDTHIIYVRSLPERDIWRLYARLLAMCGEEGIYG